MAVISQRGIARVRRVSQVAFFAAFLFLLFRSEFSGTFKGQEGAVRLPWPVSFFLEFDPLAAITTVLSTHTLYRTLWFGVVLLVATFFLGRFFCGWICPLGTIHHFFGSLKSETKRGKALIESNRYKPWQATKYSVLALVLMAAACGSVLAGWLDPISLLVRSMGLSILPGANYTLTAVTDRLYASPWAPVRFTADALQFIFQGSLASFRQPHYRQAIFLGLIFAGLVALNLRVTRFWCRAVCPLGALLGVASRYSLVHLQKDSSRCDECKRCQLHCQGGDDPIPGPKWHKAECHLCFNCVSDCPTSGVSFRVGRDTTPETTIEPVQLQRRKLMTGLVAGAAVVPLLRATTGLKVEADSRLIRPPGALDETHFLERCIRCGECMKVCPNNALHPTFMEAGVEAMWTPVLVPRVGYCEPNCVLCGQVCPTGAIWELTEAQKLGKAPLDATPTPRSDANAAKAGPVKIGTAFYDQGRCLPWAMATDCIVCEEWCPTSPKAIFVTAVEVTDAEGVTKTVRRPQVDPRRCIGCGACEYACPVRDRPAVYMTSVGETRSRTNQFILPTAPRRS